MDTVVPPAHSGWARQVASLRSAPGRENPSPAFAGSLIQLEQTRRARRATGRLIRGRAEEAFFALVADVAEDHRRAVVLRGELHQLLVGFDAPEQAVLIGALDDLGEAHRRAQAKRALHRRQRHDVVLQADLAFSRPAIHLIRGDIEPRHGPIITSTDARARVATAPAAPTGQAATR